MLLTRLAEHAAHRSDLPPPYYRNRTIRWVINIRPDGTPAAPELQDQAGPDQPAGQPLPARTSTGPGSAPQPRCWSTPSSTSSPSTPPTPGRPGRNRAPPPRLCRPAGTLA